MRHQHENTCETPSGDARPRPVVLFMTTWLAEAMCEVYIDALKETGYQVQHVSPHTGHSWILIALLQKIRPVAIILDDGHLTEGDSGRYLIQSLRRLYRTRGLLLPPLIMLTERRNYPDPSSIGVQAIWALPFPMRELVDTMHQLQRDRR
jgi:hypothetical protein